MNGWYGHANAGDDAILEVFIRQTRKQFGSSITVLSDLPENIVLMDKMLNVSSQEHPVRYISHSRKITNFITYFRAIKNCDLFVLGGGGLLRDNTSWKNLFRLLDEIWLCKIFGRKVMLFAIGVGPFKTRLGKSLIGFTVKMCDLITVRDEHSATLLKGLGIAAERIHVVSDPAFLLNERKLEDESLITCLSSTKKIGLFPALGLTCDGQNLIPAQQLARALDRIHERTKLEFIALPMRVRSNGLDDIDISNLIKSTMRFPDALTVYQKQLSPAELKWVTRQTLLNITVRLHAMIFSLGSRVPVVAINYEPKVKNVLIPFESDQYLVEIDDAFEEQLVIAVDNCLENLDCYRKNIETKIVIQEVFAKKTFDLMKSSFL